jgi:hypothetical protein
MNNKKDSIKNKLRQDIQKITRTIQADPDKDVDVDWSVFPKEIADYAKTKAKELGVDPFLPAIVVFSALGSAWMPHICWQFDNFRAMPLCVNLLILANSSVGKSVLLDPFTDLLFEREQEQRSLYREEKKHFRAAQKIIQNRIDEIKEIRKNMTREEKSVLIKKLILVSESLSEPKERRYIAENTNLASFLDVVRKNGRSSITWSSEEASAIFLSPEFRKNSAAYANYFIAMMSNKMINEERVTVEKATIHNVAINAIFLMQPEIFQKVLSGEQKIILQKCGFLNRFNIFLGKKIQHTDQNLSETRKTQEENLKSRVRNVLQIKEKHKKANKIHYKTLNLSYPENTELTECDDHELDRVVILMPKNTAEKIENLITETLEDPNFLEDEDYLRKMYIDVGNFASILFLFENENEMLEKVDRCLIQTLEIPEVFVDRAIVLAFSTFRYKRLVLNDKIRENNREDGLQDFEVFAELCYVKRFELRDKKIDDLFVISLNAKNLMTFFPVEFRKKEKMQRVKIICEMLEMVGILKTYNKEKMKYELPCIDLFGLLR